MAISTVIN